MKKLSPFKLLLIAPSILLTSCGYGLKEVYEGRPYDSTNFFENYYEVWNDKINPYKENNKITDLREERALDTEKDLVFTSFEDGNLRKNDGNWSSYNYYCDLDETPDGSKRYGPSVKMINYDESFKYGVVSKLFDGQLFCNGYYANARMQVRPQNEGKNSGFAVLFSKECDNATYISMSFKCSLVTATNQNINAGHSDLKLHISFIYKNDTGYTYVPVSYEVDHVPTNSGDSRLAPEQRANKYICFGFSLANIGKERLVGFSFQYEKISDTISGSMSEDTYHALMLYEVSFPYTTWH